MNLKYNSMLVYVEIQQHQNRFLQCLRRFKRGIQKIYQHLLKVVAWFQTTSSQWSQFKTDRPKRWSGRFSTLLIWWEGCKNWVFQVSSVYFFLFHKIKKLIFFRSRQIFEVKRNFGFWTRRNQLKNFVKGIKRAERFRIIFLGQHE